MSEKNTSNDKIIKTLTKEQTDEVSLKAIRAYDKFYRMFAGLSSDLIRYEDGIATIEVSFHEQYKQEPLAYKIAYVWQDRVKELKYADGFVVLLYTSSRPSGFHCKPTKGGSKSRGDSFKEAIEQFCKEATKPEVKELKGIYSDLYNEEVSKALNRGLTECRIDNHNIKETN